MKYFGMLICSLCLFTIGCTISSYSKEERLADSLIRSSAAIIVKKWGIKLAGTGAAMPGGPIRELTLAFNTSTPLTRDQLRVILIDAANIVVNEVNKNQEVQSYLFNPPFTKANVQVMIFNRDQTGHEVYHPGLAFAGIHDDKLTFRTVDASNTLKYRDSFTETYEEALQLLENKN